MYKNLKKLRKENKKTQEEFAESIGIPCSTYSNYEKKIREPDSDFWIKVAETYKVSIDYLMGFCDDPKGTKYGEGFQTSKNERDLIKAWRKAEEKDRRRVAIDLEDYGFRYEAPKKDAAI